MKLLPIYRMVDGSPSKPVLSVCGNAQVDDKYYDALSVYRWTGSNHKGQIKWAKTSVKGRNISLFTLVLRLVGLPSLTDNEAIYYRDGDSCNCQESNLIVITRQEKHSLMVKKRNSI